MIRTPLAFLLLGATLGLGTAGEPAPRAIAVDRWLVAGPLTGTVAEDGETPGVGRLEPPGESGVLPDRGRAAAGLEWSLLRDDGRTRFDLTELRGDAPAGSALYAHVYVRLPEDRTLRLDAAVDGDCGERRLWLNGRPLDGDRATARFGGGWNTLLVRIEVGDCRPIVAATLEAIPGTTVDGVRIQASRPYGEVRTGPASWLTAKDTAVVSDAWRWRDDRLFAGLIVELTAWGRSPVAEVEVKLEGRADGEAEAAWLVPGSTTGITVPVRLDRVGRLVEAGSVNARIEWADERREMTLRVAGTTPATSPWVELDGWRVRGVAASARAETIEGDLPNAAGWLLEGSWKIPDRLAGSTLRLNVAGAPGDYRLNGSDTRFVGDLVTLCSPCSKGSKIELTARSSGAWTAMPHVAVNGEG